MATSKPDIMIILLSKLMEEGDMFYKVRGRRRFLQMAADFPARRRHQSLGGRVLLSVLLLGSRGIRGVPSLSGGLRS